MTHEVIHNIEHCQIHYGRSSDFHFPLSVFHLDFPLQQCLWHQQAIGQHNWQLTGCQVVDGLFGYRGVRQTGVSSNIAPSMWQTTLQKEVARALKALKCFFIEAEQIIKGLESPYRSRLWTISPTCLWWSHLLERPKSHKMPPPKIHSVDLHVCLSRASLRHTMAAFYLGARWGGVSQLLHCHPEDGRWPEETHGDLPEGQCKVTALCQG